MRTTFLAASLLTLIGFAGMASAQTVSSAGTNGTSSATNSVTVNAYTGTGNGTPTATQAGLAGTGAGTGSTGSGDPTINYSGHTWTTPSVQGSYFAGANPCLIGIGGGAAGGPIGFSFNLGRSDQGCQRRSDAAAWHALGHDDVAVARMCQDDDNRIAYESVGFICPQNKPKANKVSMVIAQAPAEPPILTPPTPPAPPHPSWCDTVTGAAERAQFKTVCNF
jgi:hypothetical protein